MNLQTSRRSRAPRVLLSLLPLLLGLQVPAVRAAEPGEPQASPAQALLARAEGMVVQRAQGLLPDRNLRFGTFWTEQYKLGVPRASSSTQGSRHQAEASAGLSFVQAGPDGARAAVNARGELRRQEKRPAVEIGAGALGRLLSAVRTEVGEDRSTFAGQIRPGADEAAAAWNFELTQPDESSRNEPQAGRLSAPDGREWQVTALHAPVAPGLHPMMPAMAMPRANEGFEILDHGEAVAALTLGQPARVWLHERLSAEQRLAMVALFSALLGRQPLSLPGRS